MSFDRGTGAVGTGEASVLPINKGGTGADTAAEARTNLNLGGLFSDTSDRVGVGTVSPIAKFEVNGDIRTSPGSGGQLQLYEINNTRQNVLIAGADASGAFIDSTYATGGSGEIGFRTINAEQMRITSAGNVGIGTTSPERKLHVNDVMRLQPRNGAPSSPSKGDIYFDSADDKLKCFDGTNWQNLF
jgi:hypothetical protein